MLDSLTDWRTREAVSAGGIEGRRRFRLEPFSGWRMVLSHAATSPDSEQGPRDLAWDWRGMCCSALPRNCLFI